MYYLRLYGSNNKQLLNEVFVISRIIKVLIKGYQLKPRPLTETLMILDVTIAESNNIIVLLYIERKKKNGSHVLFFCFFTDVNTKCTNLP